MTRNLKESWLFKVMVDYVEQLERNFGQRFFQFIPYGMPLQRSYAGQMTLNEK